MVADLAWAIGSAGLCRPSDVFPSKDWFRSEEMAFRELLEELKRQPGPLEECLRRSKDRRLGGYFESLLGFWLDRHPRYQLLARNLQITDKGRTLGELDFVYLDGDETVHLEVAVKLYLGIQVDDRWYWVGPSLRDRLDIKVAKLINKQTRLSKEEACQLELERQGINVPERVMIILKGMLFRPEGTTFENAGQADLSGSSPDWTWMRLNELTGSTKTTWEILDKPNWLAARLGGTKRYADAAELGLAVAERWSTFHTPCLVVRRSQRDDREISRHFIVPDDWYEEALAMIQRSP